MVKLRTYFQTVIAGLPSLDRNTRIKHYVRVGIGATIFFGIGLYGMAYREFAALAQQRQQVTNLLLQQEKMLQTPMLSPGKVAAWVDPGLLTWVLGQVVERADTAGVVVEDANFGAVMSLAPLQGYPLTMILRGDFAGIIAFVQSVGQFEKLVGIQSLEWMTQWQGQRVAGQLYLEAKLMFVGMPQVVTQPRMSTSATVRAPSFKYRGFVFKADQKWGILEKEGKTCTLVKLQDVVADWTVVSLDAKEITLALTQSKNLSFKLKIESKN